MSDTRAADARRFAITVFDPQQACENDWVRFHAYWRQRDHEDHPGEPLPTDADRRINVLLPTPLRAVHRVFVQDANGTLIGGLGVGLRRPGTPDYESHAPFADFWGGVLDTHRRQGVATALLRELLALMNAHDRRTATAWVHRDEGRAFLSAIGAAEKHRNFENRMPFAGLDWQELAGWEASMTAPELRWEIHAGRVPLERLAALMRPMCDLVADAPMSGMRSTPFRFEIENHRTWYADMDRRGGDHFVVLLVDAHGEVAALCNANWNPRFPDRMYQSLTGVARAWRGRGLAKAVKAAMLRVVRECHPEVTLTVTVNAEANAPMLAINQRLGFAVHQQTSAYQIDAQGLAAYLATRPHHAREAFA